MAREIIKEDIPRIKDLIWDVLKTDEIASVLRMGGLTNHTYKVTMHNGDEYVVRIPGEGTEELINRRDEIISTKLATASRISTMATTCQMQKATPLLHSAR